MTLVGPLMISFQRTIRADCAVSACSPLLQPKKVIAPWLSGWGEEAFGQMSDLPTSFHIQNKANFLSTNFASLLAFEQWAAGSHSGCNSTVHFLMRKYFPLKPSRKVNIPRRCTMLTQQFHTLPDILLCPSRGQVPCWRIHMNIPDRYSLACCPTHLILLSIPGFLLWESCPFQASCIWDLLLGQRRSW